METFDVVVFVWWGLMGLMVGSFLNVAIHRLPLESETVSKPRRSRCPSCRHELTWRENVPLLSYLLQRGRCRWCSWSIPLRYPLVEVLNAGLWSLVAWLHYPDGSLSAAVLEEGPVPFAEWGVLLVQSVILSGLLVATFVDFDCYEIPDEISIGGMIAAPVVSFLLPSLHKYTWIAQELSTEPGEVDRFGALLGSLAGLAAGGGVLMLIGALGKKLYGREAMGFGDVKLLAAGGGFIGPGGALLALMLGSVVASVAGLGNVIRFTCLSRSRAASRGVAKRLGRALRVGRIAGRYLPFGPYLGIGIGIVLLAWKDVLGLVLF